MSNLDTVEAVRRAAGQTIREIKLDPDAGRSGDGGLVFTFDGFSLIIFDDGRSCCEERYMHTDDDLASFVGATFIGVEIREAANVPDSSEVHEVQFLLIDTSLGTFTIETHNVHNGYYDGFVIVARMETID